MEEKGKSLLVFSSTPMVLLVALLLVYGGADFWLGKRAPYFRRDQYFSSPGTGGGGGGDLEGDRLGRFFEGEDRRNFDREGFACDIALHSIVCVSKIPVMINTKKKNITVYINAGEFSGADMVVRPYAKQEEPLKDISPVTMVHIRNTTEAPPESCDFNHSVPAVVFSSGSTGNVFHEMNEIIIPLFITTHQFKSQVQFILEDYRPSFVGKYSRIFSQLSAYKLINPSENQSIHCFPAAVVGLKYHNNLALNSSAVPKGASMSRFRQLLRRAYDLKFTHVSQIRKPRLLLLSRTNTRRFLNEEALISLIQEVGFEVVVIKGSRMMSNLTRFAQMINSCKVLMGPHGAGLTNEIFLPDGAVMIQVELLGTGWGSDTYYGDTARAMKVHYLRYKIQPEESSLVKLYGRNSSVVTDPDSVYRKGGYRAARAVFLDLQNVRVNLTRFRDILVEALSFVTDDTGE